MVNSPAATHATAPRARTETAAGAHGQARVTAAAVALLASAALLLLASLTKSWFTADHGDGGVGLLGLESCRGAICRSVTWFDVRRVPPQIPIFATSALIACLVFAAFVVHAGVMLLQHRADRVKLGWISQLLGLAALGVCAFVFSLSVGDWSRGLALGWSAFVGIGALVATALVSVVLVRPLTKT